MSWLEITLLILVYLMSSGFIAVALAVADNMNPVFHRVLTFTCFVPGVNLVMALIVIYVFIQLLILNGKAEAEKARDTRR
ncbi:hypothetical protein [Dyadobacter sp. OTU695]|uniref:hypothetical protein n=1 Tax=Dyadobacter sp. OTU695 TaxID=3043860 RepID=UPI00313E224B